jgi:hypothetical protein
MRWNGKVNNICANDVWIGEPRYDTRLTQPCALRGPQDVDPQSQDGIDVQVTKYVQIGEPRYDTRLTQTCALRGPQDVDPHGKSTVGTRQNGKVNNIRSDR